MLVAIVLSAVAILAVIYQLLHICASVKRLHVSTELHAQQVWRAECVAAQHAQHAHCAQQAALLS